MDRTSISGRASLELVDKFCCAGDRLSIDCDVNAAVEARARKGWNKFRQIVPLLTNKDVSLLMRGKLYTSYVLSCMLHCSEWGETTWILKQKV